MTKDGYKLIGSAQLRRGRAILQHGSMRLQPDVELFAEVFGSESFSCLQIPQNLSMEKIIAVLLTTASDCFDMQFSVQPLSEDEWQAILALSQPTE
jgi:lipoate-protein ligase A